ncbi:P-loop NTPase family protein [Dyella jejuensis]
MNDACHDHLPFLSILFPGTGAGDATEAADEPACFQDLNLHRIVAAVIAGREEYNLEPFFYSKIETLDGINYRQEVMRDLERDEIMRAIAAFSSAMADMRKRLFQANKLHYRYEKERWLLGAIDLYGMAVEQLVQALRQAKPDSRGLRALAHYLDDYAQSATFQRLVADTRQLISELSRIRYALHIKGRNITVRRYDNEIDASIAIEETFAKFRQGAVHSHLAKFSHRVGLDHIDAQVLERVALFYPEIFRSLEAYGVEHAQFVDDAVVRFDREVQFYVAYLSYIGQFRARGLVFCYPRLSETSKELVGNEVFDLALADRLLRENMAIVRNDFHLHDPERLYVISGPNQGGKTTFARIFGQIHWLANIGCPVPGWEADLFLFDQLLTHFEKEEDIANLRGKLKDDLVRIRQVLDQATSRSIVIMNEIFSSTTLDDATFLGEKVLAGLSQRDTLGVCVTFLAELASFNEKTVSMMSTIDPSDPAVRTFKVERKPADGLAYALAIAEKYRVTYAWLARRIRP